MDEQKDYMPWCWNVHAHIEMPTAILTIDSI